MVALPVSQAAAKRVLHAELTIVPTSGQSRKVSFEFNPEQLSFSKSAVWRDQIGAGGHGSGTVGWISTAPRELSFAVVLDSSEEEDRRVLDDVEALLGCCEPPREGTGRTSAPTVRFAWGSELAMQAVVTRVDATYTDFWPSGVPFRARVAIDLREVSPPTRRQNPTSGGPPGRRIRTISPGDSLASLAWAEYGDAELWHDLAEVNDIEDPLVLSIGATLHVPELRELPSVLERQVLQQRGDRRDR